LSGFSIFAVDIQMKKKFLLVCSLGFVLIGLIINSCKKDNQDYIKNLFTDGHWQLASVIVTHYVGDTTKSVDTLYAECNLVQTFTFNADNTCTFVDYACDTQTSAGHWSLSSDKLYLSSDVSAVDSTGSTSKPFTTAQIYNIGQYSMVLITGNLESYYATTAKRTKVRYGFVRVKTQ
jgi:hypothetical protein